MAKLKAIIVDDEASSRNALLQKIITHCPAVKVIAECENGEQGIATIEKANPDVVFLDVEMPRMNGFVMLQQLQYRNFELIFTTAYDHYAIRAIRFSALDYLVKPIEANELISAVQRAAEKRMRAPQDSRIENLLHNIAEAKELNNRIAIPSMEGLSFLSIADIIYLEAEGNYTVIYTAGDKKYTVSKTLKDFEDLLPAPFFIRIHHSHIINKKEVLRYIKGEGGQVVMKNGVVLGVSRRRKDEFLRAALGGL